MSYEDKARMAFFAAFVLAIVGLGTVLYFSAVGAWRLVQALAVRRMKRRMRQYDGWVGKVLRHAPTGRVGFCASTGHTQHLRWGALAGRPMAQLVTCPQCACNTQTFGGFAAFGALAMGHCEMIPLSELTAALPCEQAEFLQRMESGEELA